MHLAVRDACGPKITRRERLLHLDAVRIHAVDVRIGDIDSSAHGLRTTFRTWCSDTGVPRDLAETALGHAVRDRTEAAYARSDMLGRRQPLMETWAQHIAPT